MWFAPPLLAQTYTQAVTLQPGWNAIYLEVSPEIKEIETVFAPLTASGMLESVWRRRTGTSSVQFVQNPSLLLADGDDWLTWFPVPGARTVLKSLHVVHGGHSYLIKLPSTITWGDLPGLVPEVVSVEGTSRLVKVVTPGGIDRPKRFFCLNVRQQP